MGINTANKFQFLASSNLLAVEEVAQIHAGLTTANDDCTVPEDGTNIYFMCLSSCVCIHQLGSSPNNISCINDRSPSCASNSCQNTIALQFTRNQIGIYILEVVGNTIESINWSADSHSYTILPGNTIAILDLIWNNLSSNTCTITLSSNIACSYKLLFTNRMSCVNVAYPLALWDPTFRNQTS